MGSGHVRYAHITARERERERLWVGRREKRTVGKDGGTSSYNTRAPFDRKEGQRGKGGRRGEGGEKRRVSGGEEADPTAAALCECER